MTCNKLVQVREFPEDASSPRFAQVGFSFKCVYVSTNRELVLAEQGGPDSVLDTNIDAWANPYLICSGSQTYVLYEALNSQEIHELRFLTVGSAPQVILTNPRSVFPRVWFMDGNDLLLVVAAVSDWVCPLNTGLSAVHDGTSLLSFNLISLICQSITDLPEILVNSLKISRDTAGLVQHIVLGAASTSQDFIYRASFSAGSFGSLETLLTSDETTHNFGQVNDVAALSAMGNTSLFYTATYRETNPVTSMVFVTPKLFSIYNSQVPVEISPDGFESAEHLNLTYTPSGQMSLTFNTGANSSHPRSIRNFLFQGPSDLTPSETHLYQPFFERVIGVYLECGVGVILTVSDSDDSWLSYFDSSVDPLVAGTSYISPALLTAVDRNTTIRLAALISNSMGQPLEFEWSVNAPGVSFSSPAEQATDAYFGLETPDTLTISVIVQRESEAITLQVPVSMSPHQVPIIVAPSSESFFWHKLKNLTVQVQHDNRYPITLTITASPEVSVGLEGSAPSWGSTTLTLVGGVETQTGTDYFAEFTFAVLPWHTNLAGEDLNLTLEASDSITTVSGVYPLSIGALPSVLLGQHPVSRYTYNGGIRTGDYGLGYTLLQTTSLLSNFTRVKRIFINQAPIWVFLGRHSVLWIDNWDTEEHHYMISYAPIVNADVSPYGDCAILTREYLDLYNVATPTDLVVGPIPMGLPTSFRYRDIPTRRLSFLNSLQGIPLSVKYGGFQNSWLVQTAQEFMLLTGAIHLIVDLTDLGCSANDKIVNTQFNALTSAKSGFVLVTVQQSSGDYACLSYNLATRSVARVWAGVDIPNPGFTAALIFPKAVQALV